MRITPGKIGHFFLTWRGILFLLLLTSLCLNLWGVSYGLPNRYYPDEGRIVNHALAFGMGDLNPHYFNYPAFSMYLLFIFYGIYFFSGYIFGLFQSATDFQLLFFSDPASFYLIGRILNAVVGVAVVALVYKLGKETFRNRKIGLLAGALIAPLPYFVFYSHFIVTDILQLLFILAAYIFIIRILRTGELKNYFLAGALAGLGIATMYSPVSLIVPISLAHFFFLTGNQEKFTFSRLVFPLVLAGLCMVIFFFIGSPFNFLDYKSFYESLQLRALLGEVHTYGTMSGSAWLIYPRLLFFHGVSLLNRLDVMGFIFLGGVIWAACKREKEDYLLLTFPLLLYLTMGSWSFGSCRYALPLIIFLVIWGARAIVATQSLAKKKIGGKLWRRGIISSLNGFVCLAIALSLLNSIFMNFRLTRQDTRTQAKEWVEARIPPGTAIAVEWDTEATSQIWETPDDIRAKIKAYEMGETESIHHSSEQMADVHRMRLAAVPEQNYRIIRMGSVDGTRVQMTNYSLDELRRKGVEYLISSSEVRNIFRSKLGKEIYPDHGIFYRQVEKELRLLETFRPAPLHALGPEIRIYRL